MSTKIYNAYKFNGKISDLMQHFFLFRKKWKQHHITRISSLPKTKSQKELCDLIKEQSTKSFPDWDDQFDVRGSVAVYFDKNKIYVQTFLTKLVKFIDDRFEDFHYQNQVDPWYEFENLTQDQKKIAEKNYNLRKRVWDRIFSDNQSPIEVALIYNFCDIYDYYEISAKVWNSWNAIGD